MRIALKSFVWLAVIAALGAFLQAQVSPLPTSTTALIGRFARGPVDLPALVQAAGFESQFGSEHPSSWPAELQARQFFASGGLDLYVVRVAEAPPLSSGLVGDAGNLTGLHALEPVAEVRLLLAPELSLLPAADFGQVMSQFESFLKPRRMFLILDPPPNLPDAAAAIDWVKSNVPEEASWCALYFPYLSVLLNGTRVTIPPSGTMAATYAKVDSSLGIWKSPAGTSLPLRVEALQPSVNQTDGDNLNVNQISAIREFPNLGIVPWGARTLDRVNVENRFISVVRLRQWIAASVERFLTFAAVKENDAVLRAEITQGAQDFLQSLFLSGALVGSTPREAYFVRCDTSTTSAADVAEHRVNVLLGVATLRPAEFDLISLSAATRGGAPPSPVLHQRISNGNLGLWYPIAAGYDYSLEEADSLSGVNWRGIGTPVRGNGTWGTADLAIGNGTAFYRLRIEPGR